MKIVPAALAHAARAAETPQASPAPQKQSFAAALARRPGARAKVVPSAGPSAGERARVQLDRFVASVERDRSSIERSSRRAARGEALEPADLLRLQSVVYAYAQKVDLASKVVDKAAGGVKQVMNTQV